MPGDACANAPGSSASATNCVKTWPAPGGARTDAVPRTGTVRGRDLAAHPCRAVLGGRGRLHRGSHLGHDTTGRVAAMAVPAAGCARLRPRFLNKKCGAKMGL